VLFQIQPTSEYVVEFVRVLFRDLRDGVREIECNGMPCICMMAITTTSPQDPDKLYHIVVAYDEVAANEEAKRKVNFHLSSLNFVKSFRDVVRHRVKSITGIHAVVSHARKRHIFCRGPLSAQQQQTRAAGTAWFINLFRILLVIRVIWIFV